MWKRNRQEDAYDMDNDDDDLGQRKAKMIRVRDDDLGDDADTSTPPEAGLDEIDTQHPPKLGSDSDQPNQQRLSTCSNSGRMMPHFSAPVNLMMWLRI